jgi:hypothetical protein
MGRPRCLFGLQQVFGEPFQHLLLQQEFIHDERWASRTSRGQILIMKGSTNFRRCCSLQVNFSHGHEASDSQAPPNGRSWPTCAVHAAGQSPNPSFGMSLRRSPSCHFAQSGSRPRKAAGHALSG